MHTLEYIDFLLDKYVSENGIKIAKSAQSTNLSGKVFRGPVVLGYSMLSLLKEKDGTLFHFQIWIKPHTLQYEIYRPKQPPRWYNKEVWGH